MKDTADFGWPTKPLGDLVDVLDRLRKPITKKDRKAGPYPYYGATGVLDHVDGYLFDEPLVLIGEDGAKWEAGANSAFAIEGKTWVNNHAHVIRPHRDRVLDDWLIYYLNGADLMPFISGMTVPKLNQGRLREIPIPLPPLKEQKRIVAILDEAFEGLDRARANAEANLKNARELFDKELGEIFSSKKQGWKKGTIEGLCTIRSGTTVSKSLEKVSGDLPYVKVADMNLPENIGGVLTSSRFLAKSDVSDRTIIPAGSTIFPKRGGAIMTNKKRKILIDICADLNVMGVIPGEKIDEDFLYFFFLSLDMRELGSGSSIPQINNYDIYPLGFYYPPDLHEQTQVAETLQILRNQAINLNKRYEIKLQDLGDLRQSLLQKAFAGELT